MGTEPTTSLDARYGEPDASPTPWSDVEQLLGEAELSWLATVRPDGQPHVTPLVAVYADGAPHFTTGANEQKGQNLAACPRCTLTTGVNNLHGGTDVVVEGVAVAVTDGEALQSLADAWLAKYGEEWHFKVVDGAFEHQGGRAEVFRIEPTVAYAFAKGPYSHTRYSF